MLLLTRREGQAIILDDGVGTKIRIHVLENKGKQVSIGIDAPEHVKILLEELYEPARKRK